MLGDEASGKSTINEIATKAKLHDRMNLLTFLVSLAVQLCVICCNSENNCK